MVEDIRRLSQSLDRQIYSMQSSRGMNKLNAQSKAEVSAYERFFDDTTKELNKRKEEDMEIEKKQIELDQKTIADRMKKLREMKELKETLDKQILEKQKAKEKDQLSESSSNINLETVPDFVLSIYPKIISKSRLSPEKELKKKTIYLKDSLENQIKEKRESHEQNIKKEKEKEITEREEKEKNEMVLNEEKQMLDTETKLKYKKDLEEQINYDQMKKEINNCIYGNGNRLSIESILLILFFIR